MDLWFTPCLLPDAKAMNDSIRSVFIAGLSSDIGRALAARFLAQDATVVGTRRSGGAEVEGCLSIECDIASEKSLSTVAATYGTAGGAPWDLYVSSIGTLDPIGPFFDVDAARWHESVEVNCLRQLELLKTMHPFRKRGMAHVAFFAGAGTNGPAPAYSAYSASKIFLIKMCELLHAENEDLNCFIIGPGIVRTKIHRQTLEAGGRAGSNFERIRGFLESEDPGVSHDRVYECLQWCVGAGRDAVGGRNISLVGDAWSTRGSELADALRKSPDAFRLRRDANELLRSSSR
jgi:NAD(P)-dependent dehydrogenase (short-subunit alcohol dehydrogenase family)